MRRNFTKRRNFTRRHNLTRRRNFTRLLVGLCLLVELHNCLS